MHDLVELISGGYRFSWDTIFSSLLLVMEREFGGIQGVREWEERRDLTTRFSPFLEGKKGIPGLYRILQFCQAAQVPLRGVLTGQPYPAPRALPLGTGFESKSVCLISRRNKVLDHRSIRSQVVKLVEEHDPPLSLKKIARRLHVSPGYIEYRWPGLVAANVKRNKQYRDEKKVADALNAEILVRDYLQKRLDSGLNISVKNTARTLVKESDCSGQIPPDTFFREFS
ncbi:hypothetical protein KP814_32225 [Hahella sp. HN01]|nr:hypothetical protein [Hahella sp. HN01]